MRRALVAGLVIVSASLALAAATGYRVLSDINIGGDGGWDYLTVDAAARRLYVSHATHVVVIDIDSLAVVGDIPDTPGVHGVTLAPELNRGFVSNGRSNNVTIFDLKTLKVVGQAPTGENPDSIRYDAVSGRVFTFNGRSNNATAIDANTGRVVGTIALGGKPEFSMADGKGTVFVNIEDTSEMVAIDAAKLTVTKRYSLSPCSEPSGLAFDAKDRTLFSVCSNRMMVVSNPETGKVLATPAIGAGSDGVAFDSGTGDVLSSNGDGTVTVVRQTGGQWTVAENIATERGARTIAVDEKTHRAFLPTAKTMPAQGNARPAYVPDTFKVLVIGK
jgi:DNA-binding beta-propeller fold protein YncE